MNQRLSAEMPGAFSVYELFSNLLLMIESRASTEVTSAETPGVTTRQLGKREIYADWLRFIAAFTVVFQHTVTSVWYTVPVDSSDFAALNFLNSLSRFGVGVFIMISGAFMLSPRYPHPPQKILKHNLPRTLIPLVFWVTLYGIVEALSGSFAGTSSNVGIREFADIADIAGLKNIMDCTVDVLSAPLLLFTKPAGHLWFLYTIAGLYLLTPPLRVFTEHASRKMILYVIAIFFAFGLLLPTVSHLLKTFADFSMYRNIGIQGVTTFAGFYLTGFYLAHFGISAKWRKVLYGAALASWIIAFVAATYISELRDTPNEYFFGNFRPTTFLMAAGIFAAIRAYFNEEREHKHPKIMQKTNQTALKLSGCMLGVYLIHPLFIKAFYGLHLSILEPHPIITAPIAAIIFFFLSLVVVFYLRKIPGIKKIL